MLNYEPVIGLEVHVQLLTRTKLFCRCRSRFGDEPNTNVCPVCLGLPGSLPVVNPEAVRMSLMLGTALGCTFPDRSEFARKNYFYPDCPRNYQISMHDRPLGVDGSFVLETEDGERKVGIERIHLEDDAGKLVHGRKGYSLVDFNRCGVPLVEIVTRPELRSASEALIFMRSLKQLVRYLDICDGNLEEGSIRCDVNVSLRREGSDTLGTRTEIKNLNSFKAVKVGITTEIERQKTLLEGGGRISQVTFLWDAGTRSLTEMRSKEEAHDYRYFTEPDLPPLSNSRAYDGDGIILPELPRERRERFEREYGLSPYDSGVLTAEKDVADYYEEVAGIVGDPKICCNWVMREVLGGIKAGSTSLAEFPVQAAGLAELILMVRNGTVSSSAGSSMFDEMIASSISAGEALKRMGLNQLSSGDILSGLVDSVLDESPEEVRRYLDGDKRLFGWFVGQVMKKSEGKANPEMVNDILKSRLK